MKSIPICCVLLVLMARGLDGEAEIISKVVGSPQYCINEVGQIDISYQVEHVYKNTTPKPLVVRLGLSRVLSFFLFPGRKDTDASSAVYQSNQDSVESPPFKKRLIKPGESIRWSTVATITIEGKELVSRLPKPGDYFLLPFPDIEPQDHAISLDGRTDRNRLLPITIERPTFVPPLCDHSKS